jgi:site-specific DNA recombinase
VLVEDFPRRPMRSLIAVEHDGTRQPTLALERPTEKRFGSRDITLGAEQEIDSLSLLVDRAIEVSPAAFDLYVGLVDSPGGAGTKKKIEPDPDQVENVRLMFRLALVGSDNGPMGARQIADYLNVRGIRTQTGGRWGVGAVHQVLSRTTYIGQHRFNVYSWRKKVEKPDDEIVEVAVPPIIEVDEFEAGQEMMRSRSPRLKAPRFVNAGTLLGGVCFCADCGGAMTLRTSGKGEQYRYYTCCTAARQGKTGCKGRTIPMDDLNRMVVSYMEERLLEPDRLEGLLSGLLRRREEQAERQKGRIAELRKQAADAEGKLTRLYEAIENGLAELDDSNLKGRITELKRIRDAARADADRAEGQGNEPDAQISPEALSRFAGEARRKIRAKDGGFRRHHLQMLVQRIEVGTDEIRIKGSRTKLLQTLVASGGSGGVELATNGVRSFVPNWLAGVVEDANYEFSISLLPAIPDLPKVRKRDRDRAEAIRLAGGPKPSLRDRQSP